MSEAWRNLSSGTAKAGWLMVAFVVLVGALTSSELAVVAALDARARQYHDAGASIRILKADGGVDAQRCDVLPSTNGIASAGALRSMAPVAVSSLSGLTTPAFEASRGFQALLGVDEEADHGALISESLARRWGVLAGDRIATDGGQMRIAAVFRYPENDGRDSRLANAVLFPSLGQAAFDECWADVWPSTAAFDSLIRTAMVSQSNGGSVVIASLNPSLGQVFTGPSDYSNRVTRFAPSAAAVLGLALGLIGSLRRRLEYASALHAGVPGHQLNLISLTETACWATLAAIITAGFGAGAVLLAMPSIAGTLLGNVALTCVSGAVGAVSGALLVTALVKERKLFVYFKQRT
ncbi:hypothetical protein [Arthrobacter sp. M4]|uniref:hypothetical protein n=1 Tax=Arthrobacter sp. M4 TaxID=218160 RepID=UPI001CDCA9C8|nr:hypothetical protein [Arthrobacter sp. M4]MCA4131281.1 hypothetical protein [Arthrobacter sp. M4]